MNNRDLCLR